MERLHHMVVHFCVSAPKAHCAKVTSQAPVSFLGLLMQGIAHRGAWLACAFHHAGLSLSPLSAGFSIAHGIPNLSASPASSAVSRLVGYA
jgi:hypothetical protein